MPNDHNPVRAYDPGVADWEDVRRIAEALPLVKRDAAKDGRRKWRVEGRLFGIPQQRKSRAGADS